MSENDFQKRLGDLMSQLGELPEPARTNLERLAEETRSRHDRMRKSMAEVQDSLENLRLSVKYLVFDLEATRRENRHLRTLLEGRIVEEDDEHGASGAD